MLLLTSTNDRLQIVTTSAATIAVHASWVDTSAGTITPGRTNTAISSATTTSIAGSPAASTQRNVKTVHVRNTHATLSCNITVQHTDGTITSQLYKCTLGPNTMMEYTDQGGFGGGAVAPPITGTPTRQIFTIGAGTYTTPVGVTYIEVELVGGGAGGSGGRAGAGGAAGSPGVATTFGPLTGGGGNGVTGGSGTGAQISLSGAPGGSASNAADGNTFAAGGNGGGSYFGGGGAGGYNSSGTPSSGIPGSGGCGGGTTNATQALGGAGGGGGGYCRHIFAPPAATYPYSVGAGGGGGAGGPPGAGYGGQAGLAGIIIVTEYYR